MKRERSGERWTEGEISYLFDVGRTVPDSEIGRYLRRTTDAVKSKKSELGILKTDMSRYQRIPIEPEEPTAPVLTEAEWDSPDNEIERNRVLMLFLSRLDEFDLETLDKIEEALDIARRGRKLLDGA